MAAGEVDDSVVATGMDGARIGAGDRVVTRRNDNTLAVANRESWTVSAVNHDGSLTLQGKERHVQLPAEYVASAVQLGYAATDYGNQGVTAARSATWVGPATSAGGLYVGASRGRWENTLHVVADGPDEARDVLAAALRRDRADRGLEAARARAEAEALGPPPTPAPPSPYRRGGAARPSCKRPCARSSPPGPGAGPGRPGAGHGRGRLAGRDRGRPGRSRTGPGQAAWYEGRGGTGQGRSRRAPRAGQGRVLPSEGGRPGGSGRPRALRAPGRAGEGGRAAAGRDG